MKICVAQIKSIPGDIQQNSAMHIKYVDLAVSFGAHAIFFPELSLTGYEPTSAIDLAINLGDKRLNIFQKISDSSNIIIGIGAPTMHTDGTCISMVIIQPNQSRRLYSKQFLHEDEKQYFVSGKKSPILKIGDHKIAIAICYEISAPAHCKNAYEKGANIYLASTAKYSSGIDKTLDKLSQIADKYSMTVLLSNCIGRTDGNEFAGKSSVWNDRGTLLAQLGNSQEGMLILDTETQMTSEIL
ncbi:carbon-nitrogen hydrolase family protein [Rhodohalobacter sulfatireducens]|uniref:Carbon-nitrogen hydrolase family protein n=1 Tax=Rhodohalobacter sulfatireducens TaxID=2911366 RepID=A0ABS9KEW7_9BACT|nr:carbon-nitrogen hydrolase family protein [Rhodohalobacter sulfatireducens]MCG2589406.1 carbon-nitrogen hydrolase family protein [Rhodohalobacter sulfatireducens]